VTLQTLAIFLLTAFCAGAVAWVLLYPYLSGEKEAEKRMLSVAKPGPASSKINSRAVKTRREQVEATLKDLEERRKKSNSPPLSVRLAQAGSPGRSGSSTSSARCSARSCSGG
jgi:tight adherence protein B